MKFLIGVPAIGAATLVLFCYLVFIWWLDRYEREPFWMVLAVFAWGATIGAGCGCAINMSMAVPLKESFSAFMAMSISTVVIAPLVEEVTKGLVFIPLVRTDHFDNETDGLIYGAATGLGFATVENIIYFMQFADNAQMSVKMMLFAVALRALTSAVLHAIASALIGVAVGYARHRSRRFKWFIYPAIGYVLAVIAHAGWNATSVLTTAVGPAFLLLGAVVLLLAAIAMFALTQWSLKQEHDVIRNYLEEESERGVIPRKHVSIIPYWRKRRKDDWLPDDIDKEAYVRAATLLAFRHHQLEIADGERREEYLADIEGFREEIRGYLAGKMSG